MCGAKVRSQWRRLWCRYPSAATLCKDGLVHGKSASRHEHNTLTRKTHCPFTAQSADSKPGSHMNVFLPRQLKVGQCTLIRVATRDCPVPPKLCSLPRRVCCSWQCAMPVQHARASEQARKETSPLKNTCDKQVSSWRHISCHTDNNRYYT